MIHDDGWSSALMRFLREGEERRSSDAKAGQAAITELAQRLQDGAIACRNWAFALKTATYFPEEAAHHGQALLKEPFADLSKLLVTVLDPSTGRFRGTDNILLNSFLDGVAWGSLTRIVGEPSSFLQADGKKLGLRIDDANIIERLGIAFVVVRGALGELELCSVTQEARSRRKGYPNDGGRLPRMDVIHLLEWATNHGVGCRELAERLVASGVLPDPRPTELVDPELANLFLVWKEQGSASSRAKDAEHASSPRAVVDLDPVIKAIAIWENRLKSALYELRHPRPQRHRGGGGRKR